MQCIKGSSLISINRLQKIFKCSRLKFFDIISSCHGYFFNSSNSNSQMKQAAIFIIHLLKMSHLSTDISYLSFSLPFYLQLPNETSRNIKPPKYSSADVISQNFPRKFQQIYLISVSGHFILFISKICQNVVDMIN